MGVATRGGRKEFPYIYITIKILTVREHHTRVNGLVLVKGKQLVQCVRFENFGRPVSQHKDKLLLTSHILIIS